ncbi:peptidoglycan DD-metalloendopeptidase family protein [Sediminibacterium sp.]|uniref:murein hydrolase activator EnvC family protein n=1 Tax=Sediminibacterium sp. TaxID=1917865 RepID=UPI0025D052AC|nr:peptidoglycan DD-metalloendopeptidase family protein [Sediminibacterium sp.]MBT9483798.1 peptidoglycan DD-metalloendopeptidase family protein [Sediminibacterium sp.]
MFKKIFPVLVVLLLGSLVANAQNREDLQKQKQSIEKELAELNKLYRETQKNTKTSVKQLAIIKRKINAREALVNSINREVKQLDETIYLNERDIYRLRKELDTLKVKYAKSIVFAYKNRSSYAYLNFLFSAGSFNDAMKRVTYLKSYRQNRETQANTIVKSENLLQEKIGVLSNNKKERLSTLEIQSKQLLDLQEDRKEQDQVVAQLKGKEKELNKQIRDKESQRQKVAVAINAVIRREIEEAKKRDEAKRLKALEDARKLKAAQDAAAAAAALEKKNAAGTTAKPSTTTTAKPPTNNTVVANGGSVNPPKPTLNDPATGVSSASKDRTYSPLESTPEGMEMSLNFENNRGRLPWPVSNGIVTVGFGTQSYAGTKLMQKSDGLEIAVPIGSAVRCVADGEVVYAGEVADENIVLVKHGKYFTGYKNLSSVAVSRDQKVKAGTVLGKSGTSIDGEGGILFMIMNDKSVAQNPTPWLRSK